MRIAVLSDFHFSGPLERALAETSYDQAGHAAHPVRRKWRRGLHRARRMLWNAHPEWREEAFLKSLDLAEAYQPDWLIANGDYAGDHGGVGISDVATLESAMAVVNTIRHRFPENARFILGDHDLGKYSTLMREGGIRLKSLVLGERRLGIPSFWHERDEEFHLIGVNSSLFTLDLFLPEAIAEEVPKWRRKRAEHIEQVSHAFDGLPARARVILFCHDPSALHALGQLPVITRRLRHIEMTVVGHLHSPSLLKLARIMPSHVGKWRPKYPVARIIAHGLEGVESWAQFNPVVCPSTFGTGHRGVGGMLYIEKDKHGRLKCRRRRIRRASRT